MSYGMAQALQAAIYQRLTADSALAGIPVVDALPKGQGSGTFILIGPEDVIDQSDKVGKGAEHRFSVSVISDAAGFLAAKAIAVVVSDNLIDAPLVLARGHLSGLWFLKAVARRLDEGKARRIDLTFRARVEE
jgi:Protein of unknown function (DUF3168)